MSSSKSERLTGTLLIQKVTQATGLPDDLIAAELCQLIAAAGHSLHRASLEDLREILSDYVQDILVSAKEAADEENRINNCPKVADR